MHFNNCLDMKVNVTKMWELSILRPKLHFSSSSRPNLKLMPFWTKKWQISYFIQILICCNYEILALNIYYY